MTLAPLCRRLAILLGLMLPVPACASCQAQPPPGNATPTVSATATAPPPHGPCADACTVLRLLGCPEAEPTDAGLSCAALCDLATGQGYPLPVACVLGATTVPAARSCGIRCAR